YCYFFFFSSRRRHTRFSRDWSSDVCSSDLFEHSALVHHWSFLLRHFKTAVLFLTAALLIGCASNKQPEWMRMAEKHPNKWGHYRSEERRVGKECRSSGCTTQVKKDK